MYTFIDSLLNWLLIILVIVLPIFVFYKSNLKYKWWVIVFFIILDYVNLTYVQLHTNYLLYPFNLNRCSLCDYSGKLVIFSYVILIIFLTLKLAILLIIKSRWSYFILFGIIWSLFLILIWLFRWWLWGTIYPYGWSPANDTTIDYRYYNPNRSLLRDLIEWRQKGILLNEDQIIQFK